MAVMTELIDTNASEIAAEFIKQRTLAGSPAMGMVLTLVVVVEETGAQAALEAAQRGMPTPVFRLLMIEQDVKNCGGDVAERRFRSATEKMVSWGYVQDCIEIGVKRVLH